MSDDVINLGERRAGKTHRATDWTPIEALRWLIGEIEAGRIKADRMYVAIVGDDPKTDEVVHEWVSAGNRTKLEAVGLIAQHLHFRASL